MQAHTEITDIYITLPRMVSLCQYKFIAVECKSILKSLWHLKKEVNVSIIPQILLRELDLYKVRHICIGLILEQQVLSPALEDLLHCKLLLQLFLKPNSGAHLQEHDLARVS